MFVVLCLREKALPQFFGLIAAFSIVFKALCRSTDSCKEVLHTSYFAGDCKSCLVTEG